MTLSPHPPRVQCTCDILKLCNLTRVACSCNFGNYSVILSTADQGPGPSESDKGRKTTLLESLKSVASAFHFPSVIFRWYRAKKL